MASEAIVARLKAVLSGDSSQLRTDLGKAERSLKNFGDKATKTGRSLTTKVTLPMAGLGVAAVKTAADFESSMTKITALVGVAKDEVDRMSVSVRSMATQFGKSANQAADALFYITSAGLRGATATDTLAASLKASAIGLGDTATIADLATSALNAYGSDVLSAAQATDVMTATIREGKLETTELAGSMGRVLPLASAMGVNFNEVGAAFAALSRTGTNAAEAATQIRGILSSLLRPTKQAEEALTGMGLSSEGLRRQMREEGLLATLKTLSQEFAGNEAAAASVFGNIRALSGVLDLMGANVKTTEAIFASMEDTTGAVDEAFSAVSETAAFQFQQATAEMKETLLALGQDLLPLVKDALELVSDSIRGVTDFFRGMDDNTQAAVKALAGVVAIAGPVALGIGGISKALVAFKTAHPWILAMTGAVTALSLVFADYVQDAREARERSDEMTESFKRAGDPAYLVVERLDAIAASMAKVKEEAGETGDAVESFVGEAALMGELAGMGILDTFDALGVSTEGIVGALNSGEEGFGRFAKFNELGANALRRFMEEMVAAEGPTAEMAQGILDLQASGELSNKELFDLIHTIGEQTNAVTDSNEALEDQNALLISSGDLLKKFSGTAIEPLVRKILGEYDPALNNATETLTRLADVTDDYAYQSAVDLERSLRSTGAGLLDLTDANDIAETSLVMIGGALAEAGGHLEMTRAQVDAFIRSAEGFDGLNPQIKFDLTFGDLDAQIKALRSVIGLYTTEAGISEAGKPYSQLYDALIQLQGAAGSKASSGGGGGGRGGATDAMRELERAEKEAAREAERLAREVERLSERVGDMGKVLGDEDFFEFLLGADADEIRDRFEDIAESAMELVEAAEELGVPGGPEFLQSLAAIGDEFDRLAALQDEIAGTQSNIASVEAELKDATSALADAQARLTDEQERYADFLGTGTGFEAMLDRELDTYKALKKELEGVQKGQSSFRQGIVDMMAPTVSKSHLAGGVMGNLGEILRNARSFRDNLIALRDKGFPPDVIADVVSAGMSQGNTISKRLLALGTGEFQEFLALRETISGIGAETAAIAGEVIFGADVADAQGKVGQQFAVVDAMFQSAIAEAQAQVEAQQTVVDALRESLGALQARLASLQEQVVTLAGNIQSALTTAFSTFLAGFSAQISRVNSAAAAPAPAPAPQVSRPASAPSRVTAPVTAPAPAPAPAPAAPKPLTSTLINGGGRAPGEKFHVKPRLGGGGGGPVRMRARGGPVTAGKPFLVGELGPELFVPQHAGSIVPSHRTPPNGGGGATYNISVQAHGDPAEAGRQIVRAIQDYERRNGSSWRS